MTLPRMSHSRYEDYSSCGEKYRLKRIERVPMTPSIFALAGTVFHNWTDWFDQESEHPAFLDEALFGERLAALVAEEEEKSGYALKEWDSPDRRKDANLNQFKKFCDELGPQWMRLYETWRKESGWQIAEMFEDDDGTPVLGIEFPLNFTVGKVEVIAYVDRVFLLPDGRMVAIDTKTWSKRRVTPQLPTYLVGLRKMGFDVCSAAYYEARKGEVTDLKDYKYWDEKRLAALHERAAQGIEAGFFVPRPSADCSMCDVRRHCLFELS